MTNSHRLTVSIRIGAVYVGLVLDAHVLQCSRVESNKKVLSCKRPYYDTSKQHVGCHMISGASASLSTELMLVFVFSFSSIGNIKKKSGTFHKNNQWHV